MYSFAVVKQIPALSEESVFSAIELSRQETFGSEPSALGAPDSAPWILTETRQRVQELKGRTTLRSWRVATFHDGIFQIARSNSAQLLYTVGAEPQPEAGTRRILRRLSEQERLYVLARLLNGQRENFPRLYESIAIGGRTRAFLPSVVGRIARILDSIRLYSSSERFIRSVIDELGNTRAEKQRQEELIQLGDLYQNYQREQGAFDLPGVLELLLERLAARGKPLVGVPHYLVLENPTFIFPLELALWRELGRVSRLHLVCDAAVSQLTGKDQESDRTLSLHYSSSIRELTQGSPKILHGVSPLAAVPGREDLVSYLVDYRREQGDLTESLEGISLWECTSSDDEISRVIAALAQLSGEAPKKILEKGTEHGTEKGTTPVPVEPAHILIPKGLDLYSERLRRAGVEAELKLHIPKGYPVWTSSAAGFLKELLGALNDGSLAAVERYCSHEYACRRLPTHAEIGDFFRRYSAELTEINSERIRCDIFHLWQSGEQQQVLGRLGRDGLKGNFNLVVNLASRIGIDLHGPVDWCSEILRYFARVFSAAGRADGNNLNSRAETENPLLESELSAIKEDIIEDTEEDVAEDIEGVIEEELRRRQNEFSEILAELIVLSTVRSVGEDIRGASPVDTLRGVRRLFSRDRLRLRQLSRIQRLQLGEVTPISPRQRRIEKLQLLSHLQSLREIYRLLRQITAEASTAIWLNEMEKENLYPAVAGEILKRLGETYAGRGEDGAAAGVTPAAVVTELLDARAIRGKRVFVLGLVGHLFNVTQVGPGDQLDDVERRVRAKSVNLGSSDEFYYLLGALLRNNREVTFSTTQDSEENIPQFLKELAALLTSGRPGAVVGPAQPPLLSDRVSAYAQVDNLSAAILIEGQRRALAARSRGVLSEYDGVVAPAALETLAKIGSTNETPPHRVFYRAQTRRYSVTELETFADCPHRFLFRSVLGLSPPAASLAAGLESELGRLVHLALHRFFISKGGGPVTAESFSDDCLQLLEIARQLRQRSGVNWKTHPAFEQIWLRAVAGLDRPEPANGKVKRGMLRAALEYERDLIAPGAQIDWRRTEWRFGGKSVDGNKLGRNRSGSSSNTLEIPIGSGGKIQIQGIIDRIDGRQGADGRPEVVAVWDYKTGKRSTLAEVEQGRSLQLPLYAAAVKAAIAMPGRGALISLASPNRNGDQITSLASGVLIEHLAVSRKGNKLVFDPQAVTGRVEATLDHVKSYDAKIAQGKFSQQLETKACPYCEMRRICLRDEVALEEKLAEPTAEAESQLGAQSQLDAKSKLIVESGPSVARPLPPSLPLPRSRLLVGPTRGQLTLSAEQEAACDVSKDVALVAGAGSGKTAVLTARFIELLVRGEPLRSIVAISFTQKAAQELRERIEEQLSVVLRSGAYRGRELSAAERGFLLAAQADFAAAQLGTIHSFVGTVIRMSPELAGVDPAAEILTDGSRAELLDRVVEQLLQNPEQSSNWPGESSNLVNSDDDHSSRRSMCQESTGGLVRHLIGQGITYRALSSNLRDLISSPFFLNATAELFSGDDTAAKAVSSFIERYRNAKIDQAAVELDRFLEEWIPAVARWLETADEKLLASSSRSDFSTLIAMALKVRESIARRVLASDPSAAYGFSDQLRELQLFLTSNRESAKSRSPKNPRNYWKELRDYLEEIEILTWFRPAEREVQAIELASQLLQLARRGRERYQALKMERGVVDFDDLILTAHKMVCGHHDGKQQIEQQVILRRLQQSYKHLMVDEFQDTDRWQWEVLRKVIKGHDKDNGSNTVFFVGDPQQAIYGFRGGDITVFRQATQEILSGDSSNGASLTLSDNYRSALEIVQFVNSFFERLFEVDFGVDGRPRVLSAVHGFTLNARRAANSEGSSIGDTTDNQPGVYLFDCKRAVPGGPATDTEEAEQVSELVDSVLSRDSQFLQEGTGKRGKSWPAIVPGSGRPQIAVLTRNVRQLMLVASALRVRKVRFSISHSSGFYELPEILQLENLLRAISPVGDRIALVGALRSALFGLSDTELVELFAALGQRWELLLDSGRLDSVGPVALPAKFEAVRELLRCWKRLLRVTPVSQLLETVVAECALSERYLEVGEPEMLENIHRFVGRVREAELAGEFAGGVVALLRWLELERGGGSKAPNANRTDSDVVLMTVHGSKGLEFPMVILPFLHRRPPPARDFFKGHLAIWSNGGVQHRSDPSDLGGGEERTVDERHAVLSLRVEDDEQEFKRTATMLERALVEATSGADAAEERRVFYVACTRARDYLVLTSRSEQRENTQRENTQSELLHYSQSPAQWLAALRPTPLRALSLRGENHKEIS